MNKVDFISKKVEALKRLTPPPLELFRGIRVLGKRSLNPLNPAALLDELRGHGFDVVADGEGVKLLAMDAGAVLPDELRARFEANRPALADLLRTLPAFTHVEEVELVDYYVGRPRAERLAMHAAGKGYHARGWPWREADLQAMRDHCERNP